MKKLTVFILSFVYVLCLYGCSKEAASIGIIGGADGPTAIFAASDINWLSVFCLIGIVLAIILLIAYRNKRKK